MAIISSALAKINRDPLAVLGGAERVNQVFEQVGHRWRERQLNPATTVALFIVQVLNGNTAIEHLRHLTGRAMSASSYCAARMRLPLAGLGRLIEHLCAECSQCVEPRDGLFRGHKVWLADATSATMPDVPALQKIWPQPNGQKSGCGFPVIKLLGVFDAFSGLIRHVSMMSLLVHEATQVVGLNAIIRAGDILLADRGFCSFVNLAWLHLQGIFAVLRMHQRKIVSFAGERGRSSSSNKKRKNQRRRRQRCSSRRLRTLGVEDQLCEWFKPAQKPKWVPLTLWQLLPSSLIVRELRYTIRRGGYRTRALTIATTLLDPARYPKHEIARLYGLRWEVETHFRELKQTLKMDMLKCKSTDGVIKELMIYLLVYNLVRMMMLAAARRQRVPVDRISFIDAWRFLLGRLTGRGLLPLRTNPYRPGRWQPRVLKRRMKEYDLMTRPRWQYPQPSPEPTFTD